MAYVGGVGHHGNLAMTTLLIPKRDLEARGTVATGALRPLGESLAADLDTLAARPLYIPREKALLSREGGRCARDGTLL